MKKTVFILLVLFTAPNLFSQINKGDVIITFDGNYFQVPSENGVNSNQNYTKSKILNVGPSIGYLICKSFVAGIGFDYSWNKEFRLNTFSINPSFIQKEQMNIKSKIFLPNVYLGYYYQISNKLIFNTNLKLGYGKIKSDIISLYTSASKLLDTSNVITSGSSMVHYETKSEAELLNVKISPELTYYIFTNVGFSLIFGGVEYTMLDWKADNSNWIINFNPNSWRFGIKVRISRTSLNK